MNGSRNFLEMDLLPLVSYSEIATGGVLDSCEICEASSLFILHCECLGSWVNLSESPAVDSCVERLEAEIGWGQAELVCQAKHSLCIIDWAFLSDGEPFAFKQQSRR